MLDLEKLLQKAKNEIKEAADLAKLRNLEIRYLGRNGELTLFLRSLKDFAIEERKKLGASANKIRDELESLIREKIHTVGKKEIEERLSTEKIDITAPGRRLPKGHLHPVTILRRDIEEIFRDLGFSSVGGPEIELEWYNFDSLNIPKYHPARDMQDTLWLKEKPIAIKRGGENILSRLLMRTQVTSIQVRFMEKNNPPFSIIMPGNVYRRETPDASHEIQFTQMDGIVVGPDASLANMKWVMDAVLRKIFGKKVATRLRPSYFPFTEPSVELDMECFVCGGKGCSVCKRTGWVEILPGGMVHPKVFEAAGMNPRDHQGYAFDLGIDRICMMKYKIPDIRLFHSQDLRFINQF
ncbi:phenylalanine--tRNA ligase subunit alpha [Candidatus Giovannonibacteria bacterium]|nr:phenylalanine--tRNA ligase subunit alpha [Candidatus Giovannonibacteria bacterium]